MAAKAKLTVEQRQLIVSVMSARRALPSDKQLARQLGISVSALYRTMERLGAPPDWLELSRENYEAPLPP